MRQYRLQTFESVIHAPVVDKGKLRQLSWNGVPSQYRATVWQILCGYLPANASRREGTLRRKRKEYHAFADRCYDAPGPNDKETLRQIRLDVPRTAPHVALFQHPRVRTCLERLLYTWAVRHPAASYVQGINDVVTPILAVFLADRCFSADLKALLSVDGYAKSNKTAIMDMLMSSVSKEDMDSVEADCFWCLTSLLSGIQNHYTADQPGLQRMIRRLEDCMQIADGDLHSHLVNKGIDYMHFAYRWMNCLLLRELSFLRIVRMWDTYFAEGLSILEATANSNRGEGGAPGSSLLQDCAFDSFHVFVCAAMLIRFAAKAKSMQDFDELFFFLQNLPTDSWTEHDVELLLSEAFVLRSNLEKKKPREEYSTCDGERKVGSSSLSDRSLCDRDRTTLVQKVRSLPPMDLSLVSVQMATFRENVNQAFKDQIEQAVSIVKSVDISMPPPTSLAEPSVADGGDSMPDTSMMYDVNYLSL